MRDIPDEVARAPDRVARTTRVSRTLVIGAGWLGSAIADSLRVGGGAVWTMQRSTSDAASDAEARAGRIRADVTGWADRAAVPSWEGEMPPAVDAVVLCVAPARGRGDTHEGTYPSAARGALNVAAQLSARCLLYVSSTGVYGRTDGSVVTESTPVVRDDARQRSLADADDIVMQGAATHGIGTVVLRAAGLYGPSRDPASRFADESALDAGGEYWCNFAWRDDVVSAVTHLAAVPAHRIGPHCFNCADGHPVLARDVARALAPSRDVMNAHSRPADGMARPRARSNQRVSIDRLRETGWMPRVTDVYDGLARLGHTVVRP